MSATAGCITECQIAGGKVSVSCSVSSSSGESFGISITVDFAKSVNLINQSIKQEIASYMSDSLKVPTLVNEVILSGGFV